MNDKELADRVVALGVAEFDKNLSSALAYSVRNKYGHWDYFEAELLVTDWGVVGTLMEKVDAHFIERLSEKVWAVRSDKPYGEGKTRNWYENESLPRAITEACCEALSDE